MSKDNIELLITIFLLVSIIFLTINYNLEIGIIFVGMILASIYIFFAFPAKITYNSTPNNTKNALFKATIALVIIITITFFATTVFQGVLNITEEPSLQSIIHSGFSSLGFENIVPATSQPIFSQSAFLMILTFGIVIATIETMFLARIMEGLARILKISLERLDKKVISLFFIISALFVAYHFNAKGVTNNVALIITFFFAFISLELIRRSKEIEPAVYLHVFNNLLFIIPTVQAQIGGN